MNAKLIQLMWTLIATIGATLALGIVGVASAVPVAFPPLPMLVFQLDGSVAPRKLPMHKLSSAGLEIQGTITYSDGSWPPALREVVADFDKSVAIDTEGLAACGGSQIRFRDTEAARRVCRKSIVGTGVAHIGIEPLGQEPFAVSAQLTFFNGGTRDGTTTLLIHGWSSALGSGPIVARVEIGRGGQRSTGLHTVAKFPPIAEGNGTLLDFRFKIEKRFWRDDAARSYLLAKCPDGHLPASFPKVLFRQEVPVPGRARLTVLKGSLYFPCTPEK